MQSNTTTWPNKPEYLFGLLMIALLLLSSMARGAAEPPPPYIIHSLPDDARVTIYSEYLRDDEGTLTIQQVSSPTSAERFQPATRYVERLGIQQNPWWVRLAIKNEFREHSTFALQLRGNPNASLYQPAANGQGYTLAPPSARIPGRDASFRVHLPVGEQQLLYLRLQPRGYLTYGLSLSTLNDHLAGQQRQNAIYMVLTGALLILIIYNLIAGTMRGGGPYWYHAGFLTCITLISLLLADFLPHRFTDGNQLQPRILFPLMLIAMGSAAGVTRSYFRLNQDHSWLNHTTRVLLILTIISLPLTQLLPITLTAYLCFSLVSLSALLLIAMGYATWHREQNGGGLFLITTLFVSLPALVLGLAYLGLLQTSAELPQWLMVSTVVEALTLGIGLRVRFAHRAQIRIEHQRSQAIADTVDSTRRETLARIGHDIRTPLSGILGMSEILVDTPLTPNQRECVSAIQNAGDNLLRIINDVLEHSQLSTSSGNVNQASLDVHELLMEAIDLFKERAEEKQIELITHVHTNVPPRVLGDAGRLRQVLTNLTGALIRHGTPGELIIDVSLEPTGQADRVRFGFSGSALSEEALKRLQDTQRQSESSHLSLVIAEQLVDALHGRMGNLQDQRGTHYWFVVPLPADHAAPPKAPRVDTSSLEGRSLLVVDDSSTVTRVLRHHALSWGMRVTACHDPREALASLRTQANINEPFDVVVLDQQMPGMDGMQLAARIHEDPVIVHPTVLVMLTGIQHAPSATQARNVGIHRVLSKPVSAPRLRQVLAEELCSDVRPTPETVDAKPNPDLRILVAEDHYLSQKVIRGMLGKLGLQADIASDGQEALALAEKQRYDLILMDCEMPEMDGFEATRRIRQHEQRHALPSTPIVALTAHILKEHKDRSFAAGMNAHLPKPVELNTLRETILRFTRDDGTDSGSPLANGETLD
ncbi:hybrid sensor histidine kinase/response regulator [Alcanivorax sp. DP30]|uniref:hybrid sensor histidine kinase/response regulator n=1 Tax=Alcanivorax sp. DP30 TaxID=2606217 RepID=UPI001367CFF5|nr:hybrid sensor histidine kinase/response regulator [Alcanivorax sp. DP30]MZR63638.1 response regulator [Alcanivorax sp. DP30]